MQKGMEDDNTYLCLDRPKKRDQGRYCICNESKNTYREYTPKTNFFDQHKCFIQLKIEKI